MKAISRGLLATVCLSISVTSLATPGAASETRSQASVAPIWSSGLFVSSQGEHSVWIGDVATTPTGETIAAGTFSGSMTVGTGSDAQSIQAVSYRDGFISHYASDGSLKTLMSVKPGDSNSAVIVRKVTVTPDGGYVLAAEVRDSAEFGPNGTGRVVLGRNQNGMALAKYSAAGAFQWVEHTRGAVGTECEFQDVAVDSAGVIYVGGTAKGLVQLSGGSDTQPVGQSTGRAQMAFVAKYSPAGQLLSATNVSDTSEPNDYTGGDIAVGPDGAVTIVGSVNFAPASFGTGSREATLKYPGPFVAQFSSSGELRWVTGQSSDETRGAVGRVVAVNASGQVFTAGNFWRTVTLGTDDKNVTLTSRGATAAYVASYSSSGAIQWARPIAATSEASSRGLDFVNGLVVVTGDFRGRMPLSIRSGDIVLEATSQAAFLIALNSNGDTQWATQTTGRWSSSSQGISTRPDGRVTLAGTFYNSVGFGEHHPALALTAPLGETNSFLVSYEPPAVSAPSPPRSIRVTSGNGLINVSWSPPISNGGSPIVGYTATASPSGLACQTTGSTSCIITGLENGVAQTVTVTATNGSSTSEPSDPSVSVTPEAKPVRPGAVTALKAVGTAGAVKVTWAPPSGATPTRYDYRVGRGKWIATSSLTVTVKAKRGSTITVAVRAVNAAGDGPVSVATARAK